jgi:micrococcal nuclease
LRASACELQGDATSGSGPGFVPAGDDCSFIQYNDDPDNALHGLAPSGYSRARAFSRTQPKHFASIIMDRITLSFWSLVLGLCCATAFFVSGIVGQQATQQQREAKLESGDLVQLVKVVDGDTVVVSKEGQNAATVRLLGIKTLESKHGKDEVAVYGRAAEEALKRLVGDRPLRVLLNTPPRDRHGRTLATLYAGDQDIGIGMVSQGHALVYSVYPFASMPVYLQAQVTARAKSLGLWGDPEVSAKAEAMINEWARQGS